MAGLYIHIPFCASRCIYCGFYSTTLSDLQNRYTDALCQEMKLRKEMGEDSSHVETIYIGGGTPSQLSIENLSKLFSTINHIYGKRPFTEITMECNPDDLTPEYVEAISHLPINRISMGAQTFDDQRLRFLHRRHTAEEVRLAVHRLRNAGISNISIDLMFGFPHETLEDWEKDIDAALSLDVEHISAYSLMIEEDTPLYHMFEKSQETLSIDEELSLQMYETLINRLTAAGFEHYEISNFARHGFRSRHNSNYWNATPYIGIGAAAHSYDLSSRQWNISNIHSYIEAIEQGKIPCEREILDADTHYNDLVTTALRTREGIALSRLDNKYREHLLHYAEPHIQNGTLCIDKQHIHLTRKGLFVSDDIMSDLIYIE